MWSPQVAAAFNHHSHAGVRLFGGLYLLFATRTRVKVSYQIPRKSLLKLLKDKVVVPAAIKARAVVRWLRAVVHWLRARLQPLAAFVRRLLRLCLAVARMFFPVAMTTLCAVAFSHSCIESLVRWRCDTAPCLTLCAILAASGLAPVLTGPCQSLGLVLTFVSAFHVYIPPNTANWTHHQ